MSADSQHMTDPSPRPLVEAAHFAADLSAASLPSTVLSSADPSSACSPGPFFNKAYRNASRRFSLIDRIITTVDRSLKTLLVKPTAARANPASTPTCTRDNSQAHITLSPTERRHSAGLMRVNHVGEICAQALYQGQALTARDPNTVHAMQQAADEEQDHLAWCQERLDTLGSHVSYLNPVWYLGALTIGIAAGLLGDRWSLGFVAETETQVVKHLDSHAVILPAHDQASRAIIIQMRQDEAQHAEQAILAGAAPLPSWVKQLMAATSAIMTRTAYYW